MIYVIESGDYEDRHTEQVLQHSKKFTHQQLCALEQEYKNSVQLIIVKEYDKQTKEFLWDENTVEISFIDWLIKEKKFKLVEHIIYNEDSRIDDYQYDYNYSGRKIKIKKIYK